MMRSLKRVLLFVLVFSVTRATWPPADSFSHRAFFSAPSVEVAENRPSFSDQALALAALSIPNHRRQNTLTLGGLIPASLRRTSRKVLFPTIGAAMLLAHAMVAKAQSEWTVSMEASFFNPTLIGKITPRPSQDLTLGARWTMHQGNRVRIHWTPEVMPLFLISEPHEDHYFYISQYSKTYGYTYTYDVHVQQGPRTIYGAGAIPIKFRFDLFPTWHLVPYIDLGAGFVETTTESPYQGSIGTKFNYRLETGGGVSWTLRHGNKLSLGLTYEHNSNGHISDGTSVIPVDPGVDFLKARFELIFTRHKAPHEKSWFLRRSA